MTTLYDIILELLAWFVPIEILAVWQVNVISTFTIIVAFAGILLPFWIIFQIFKMVTDTGGRRGRGWLR